MLCMYVLKLYFIPAGLQPKIMQVEFELSFMRLTTGCVLEELFETVTELLLNQHLNSILGCKLSSSK